MERPAQDARKIARLEQYDLPSRQLKEEKRSVAELLMQMKNLVIEADIDGQLEEYC